MATNYERFTPCTKTNYKICFRNAQKARNYFIFMSYLFGVSVASKWPDFKKFTTKIKDVTLSHFVNSYCLQVSVRVVHYKRGGLTFWIFWYFSYFNIFCIRVIFNKLYFRRQYKRN